MSLIRARRKLLWHLPKRMRTWKMMYLLQINILGRIPMRAKKLDMKRKIKMLEEDQDDEMGKKDRVTEETKKKKDAVLTYVYDLRSKLYQKYFDFVTWGDRKTLMAKLQEVEDWLYGDGKDETKGVYAAKLEELEKVDAAIEACYREWRETGSALEQLVCCIRSSREAALSSDPEFDLIDMSDKQKVVDECSGVQNWLVGLLKNASPDLLASDLTKKAEALDRFCKPIMTNPKPASKPWTPPPSEIPASEAQTPEQHSDGATEASESASEGGAQG